MTGWVEFGHSEIAFRISWLFFEADGPAVPIEFNHSITFRIAQRVPKNATAFFDSESS